MSENEMFTRADSENAAYAALRSDPVSPEAHLVVAKLACELWRHDLYRKRVVPGVPFTLAVGSLVGDLLANAYSDPMRYTYRSFRREEFTGERIGYTTFKAAYDALLAFGYVYRGQRGHQQWGELSGEDGTRGGLSWSKATRFRATDKLIALAASHGVPLDAWGDHFLTRPPPNAVAHPIVRRAAKTGGRQRFTGVDMMIDYALDTKAALLRDQVDALNAFIAGHDILPNVFIGLRRIFNEGDVAGFDWNRGGRMTAIGGTYQSFSKTKRLTMTIDGEPVVEIDIGSSHLTILRALRGDTFDPRAGDQYDVPGIPRDVVKAWVTMTLGYHRLHIRWSDKTKARLSTDLGCDLQKAYPLRVVREAILNQLPILRDWGSGYPRWYDLQYVESRIIVAVMTKLIVEHGVACLPVHDSIIVPRSRLGLAEDCLREAFQAEVGVCPKLTTSPSTAS